MGDGDTRRTIAAERALLEVLSNSLRRAIAAVGCADLDRLETETARQSEILRQIRIGPGRTPNALPMGDGGADGCARDQQALRAALALQTSVLGRAIQRSLRTLSALRALHAGKEGIYTAAVSARRS